MHISSVMLDSNTYPSFQISQYRSSHPEVFLGKGVLKIYSKLIGEHPCRSVISIKLESNFIETALRHGCSPVNLLHIFRTLFLKNTPGWLLLTIIIRQCLYCLNTSRNSIQSSKSSKISPFHFYITNMYPGWDMSMRAGTIDGKIFRNKNLIQEKVMLK